MGKGFERFGNRKPDYSSRDKFFEGTKQIKSQILNFFLLFSKPILHHHHRKIAAYHIRTHHQKYIFGSAIGFLLVKLLLTLFSSLGGTTLAQDANTQYIIGDGVISQYEQCDDSNTFDGDGCSSLGQIESGATCIGEPSICSISLPDIQLDNTITQVDISPSRQLISPKSITSSPIKLSDMDDIDLINYLYGPDSQFVQSRSNHQCSLSNLDIIRLSPGYNTIPTFLAANTLYLLESGNYDSKYMINIENDCTAIVGLEGGVTLHTTVNKGANIKISSGSNNILYNLTLNGSNTSTGLIHTPNNYGIFISIPDNTVQNISAYDTIGFSVYIENFQNHVSNISRYDSSLGLVSDAVNVPIILPSQFTGDNIVDLLSDNGYALSGYSWQSIRPFNLVSNSIFPINLNIYSIDYQIWLSIFSGSKISNLDGSNFTGILLSPKTISILSIQSYFSGQNILSAFKISSDQNFIQSLDSLDNPQNFLVNVLLPDLTSPSDIYIYHSYDGIIWNPIPLYQIKDSTSGSIISFESNQFGQFAIIQSAKDQTLISDLDIIVSTPSQPDTNDSLQDLISGLTQIGIPVQGELQIAGSTQIKTPNFDQKISDGSDLIKSQTPETKEKKDKEEKEKKDKEKEDKKTKFKDKLRGRGYYENGAGKMIGTGSLDIGELSGEIDAPTIMQSTGDTDIQVELPEGIVVKTISGLNYTGILDIPRFTTGNVNIQNFTPIRIIKVGPGTPNLFFYAGSGNDAYVDVKIPTSGLSVGTQVAVNYSTDGNVWKHLTNTNIISISGSNYAVFQTNHFTLFAVGLITRDNTDFLDSNFWNENPTSGNIIKAIYGSGIGDTTAYNKYRTGLCNPASISVVNVSNYASSGSDVIPQNLSANTIYVLGSGGHVTTRQIAPNTCSAIVGRGDVTLYSAGQPSGRPGAMIAIGSKSGVVLDNIKIDGKYNITGTTHLINNYGIYSEGAVLGITMNDIEVSYSAGDAGIYLQNMGSSASLYLNQVKSHNNGNRGLYLRSSGIGIQNAVLDNLEIFNNTSYGMAVEGLSYLTVNNSKFYNNGDYGIFTRYTSEYNTFNNIASFNNIGAGLYIDFNGYNVISNSSFYNNTTYGLMLANSSYNKLNNIKAYNNDTGIYVQQRGNTNKYYGTLQRGYNTTTNYAGTNLSDSALSAGTDGLVGWSNGSYSTMGGSMSCIYAINPNNGINSLLSSPCSTKGYSGGWSDATTFGVTYDFGTGIQTQIQPVYYINSSTLTGSDLAFDGSGFITYEVVGGTGEQGDLPPSLSSPYVLSGNTTYNTPNYFYKGVLDVASDVSDVDGLSTGTCMYTTGSTWNTALYSGTSTAGYCYQSNISLGLDFDISFRILDLAGNTGYSSTGTYVYDSNAPTGLSFTINDGATSTTSRNVTLNITCPTDGGAGGVQISYGNTTGSYGERTSCLATQSHTLSIGTGTKTVYMRAQDSLNNISTDYLDTITLNDSVPVDVESFIDSAFWDASPTSGDIIQAIYGSGIGAATAYNKYWTGLCNPASISVVNVSNYASSGSDIIPQNLSANTIYVLGSGGHVTTRQISPNTCSAILGRGDVTLYSAGQPSGRPGAMIAISSKSGVVLDNIKIDGKYNINGTTHLINSYGIYSEASVLGITMNNIEVSYSDGNGGIYMQGMGVDAIVYLNQVKSHNNTNRGIYIKSSGNGVKKVVIDNSEIYNNGAYGLIIENLPYLTVNNSKFYNNGDHGIFTRYDSMYNTFNNIASFNNSGAGLYIDYNGYNVISNSSFYNNTTYGLMLANSSNNTLNNIKAYNNDTGIYVQQRGNTNKYYGTLQRGYNTTTNYAGTNLSDSALSAGTDGLVGWSNGSYSTMGGSMSCIYAINPNNGINSLLSSPCSSKGYSGGWFDGTTFGVTYDFGTGVQTQIQPVYYASSSTITGVDLAFDESEFITYAIVGSSGQGDTTPPTLSQVTPVPTPTNDTTPNYTFSSTESGTITYGGSCSSSTTSAISGNNTITFNSLSAGTYSDCTITVTDTASNASTALTVPSFTIDTTAPTASIDYDPNTTTNQNVTATLTGFSKTGITITNNYGSSIYVFTGNGTFTFDFVDLAGNTGSQIATVDRIQLTASHSITDISLDPSLNISRFAPYTLITQTSGVMLSGELNLGVLDGDNNSCRNYYADGTCDSEIMNFPLVNSGNNTLVKTGIYPDYIYPEIFFAPSSITWNNTPLQTTINRNSYHIFNMTNPFAMVDEMSFWIELNAVPNNINNSSDLLVYLVGNDQILSDFTSDWRNNVNVELVGTLNRSSESHHTHTVNSSHHLVALATNPDGTIGSKNINVSGQFWIVLYQEAPNNNRGWNLRYQDSSLCTSTGSWYTAGSFTTPIQQAGCPDAHIHIARRSANQDLVSADITMYYQDGETISIITGNSTFSFGTPPNMPPNQTSFINPLGLGVYNTDINIGWNPVSDPNNDSLIYNLYLLSSTGTRLSTIATGISTTGYFRDISLISDGEYGLELESCDPGLLCSQSYLDDNFFLDTTPATIIFTGATPLDQSTLASNNFTIQLSIQDNLGLDSFAYIYDGTTYNIYDSGLLLMYNLDNISSLGETSSLVKDFSTYSNTGTIYGSPGHISSGVWNGAYSFDGVSNQYISIGDGLGASLGTTHTISVWINPSTNTGAVIGQMSGVSAILLSGDRLYYGVGPGDNVYFDTNMSLNTWAHFTIVRDSNNVSLYLNGALVSTKTLSTNTPLDIFYIAKENNDGTNEKRFSGYIDELLIYDRTLSTGEISQLYRSNLSVGADNEWLYTTDYSCVVTGGNYIYTGIVLDRASNASTVQNSTTINLPSPLSNLSAAPASLGQIDFSYDTQSISGQAQDYFKVTDRLGKSAWYTTIALPSSLQNSINPSYNISGSNIYFKSDGINTISGVSTDNIYVVGDFSDYVNLPGASTYISRDQSDIPFMCKGGIYGDRPYFKVEIPGGQSMGSYSGTITYDIIY